jgi:hypothetical protein
MAFTAPFPHKMGARRLDVNFDNFDNLDRLQAAKTAAIPPVLPLVSQHLVISAESRPSRLRL